MAALPETVGKLPQRLRNFFARYPPHIYSALVAPRPTPPETEAAMEETLPSPYTPDREAKGVHKADPRAWSPSRALLYSDPKHHNPFLPKKIFRTGKWMGPRYGLRQQADLVKLAKIYDVEALLPPGPKSTEYKATRLTERGLQVKGTGIGQKVKGHKWERTMEARLEDRRKAMVEMPEMIRLWKQVSKIGRPMLTQWMLITFNREDMVVAGDSGPSGEQDKPVDIFVCISILINHFTVTSRSTPNLEHQYIGSTFGRGYVRTIAGVWERSSSDLHDLRISVLYYTIGRPTVHKSCVWS